MHRGSSTADGGRVPCQVVEALPAANAEDCSKTPGRSPLTGDGGTGLEAAVRARMKQEGKCDGPGQPACSDFDMCLINQLDSTGLASCLNDQVVKPGVDGYCYIDQTCVNNRTCSSQLIAQCPATDRPAALRRSRHDDARQRRQRVHLVHSLG